MKLNEINSDHAAYQTRIQNTINDMLKAYFNIAEYLAQIMPTHTVDNLLVETQNAFNTLEYWKRDLKTLFDIKVVIVGDRDAFNIVVPPIEDSSPEGLNKCIRQCALYITEFNSALNRLAIVLTKTFDDLTYDIDSSHIDILDTVKREIKFLPNDTEFNSSNWTNFVENFKKTHSRRFKKADQ